MPVGLNVSDLINVTVTLSPVAAGTRNFGAMCFAGPSDVIDVGERERQYTELDGVGQDFSLTDPEFLAAELWFSQVPTPNLLNIGRWAQANTSGILRGGALTGIQAAALVTTLGAMTNGGFLIYLDGTPHAVTALNFNTPLISNLNAAAAVIQAALTALDAGTTCIWNATYGYFQTESGTAGPSSSVSAAVAPTGLGNYTFVTNPANLDTMTLNGTAVEFVTGAPTGNEVQIGADLAHTLANLMIFLDGSADVQIVKFKYVLVGDVVYCLAATPGAGGDALTITASSTHFSASGATLVGGNAVDAATPSLLTAAGGAVPVGGIAAETPEACAAVLLGPSAPFGSYGFAMTPVNAGDITDAEYEALAAFIEANSPVNILAITSQETATLNPSDTSNLAYTLRQSGFKRSFTQFSSSSLYAACSAFGRAFTVNFDGTDTTITLMYKSEPGVTPESLTETQAAALKSFNANVYATYQNGIPIIQWGTMANGFFLDEVMGTDWLQNAVQVAVFNLLYQTPTKIPQTDPGIHQIVTTIANTMEQAVNNGLIGAGLTWTGPPIGPAKAPLINTGQILPAGYAIYQPPVATQSASARSARAAPVLQVAACLAGAVHTSSILINVVR
jgi:hypothetical protein